MSENKREILKVTIEHDEGTQVIECNGIAGITVEDTGENHKMACLVIGKMSVADLLALHDNIEKELLPALRKQIVGHVIGGK